MVGTFMLHSIVTFWISLVLCRVKVSLMMTPFGVSCRLRGGSNNTDIPGQWQCANCDANRCWPVRRNCCRCGAPRPDTPPAPAPWNAGRARGRSKGPLGRDPPPGSSSVPPTTREPRVVPPRGPPGAGVGTPPRNADSDVLPWRAAWSAQASSDSHVCRGLLQV